MQPENDLLSEFEQEHGIKRNYFSFRFTAILYALNVITSIVFIFITIKVKQLHLGVLLSNSGNVKFLIVFLLIVRLSPIIALLLFILKKKLGWMLVSVLSIVDVAFKGVFAIKFCLNFISYAEVSRVTVTGYFLNLIISVLILCFLFTNSVLEIFRVSNKIKLITTLMALILWGSRFFLLDLSKLI
jgi:hypothetical protein